jgi:hypothetical protein
MKNGVQGTASFSPCERYRYTLTRTWPDSLGVHGSEPLLPFVMLNPSVADAMQDDRTIARCQGFARREGYGGIMVLNLYAFRATYPKDLWVIEDPVGPDNDRVLDTTLQFAVTDGTPVVCAWGSNAKADRVRSFMEMAARYGHPERPLLYALGVTKAGAPRHPLYLRGDAPLVPWVAP